MRLRAIKGGKHFFVFKTLNKFPESDPSIFVIFFCNLPVIEIPANDILIDK